MENIVMERKYTAEEYYNALEWIRERSELINGGIDYMPTPGIKHQQLVLKLAARIDAYLSSRRSGMFLLMGADVKLNDTNIVVPDISVASDRSKLDDVKYNGVPELIIEVASDTPSDDYFKKLVLYKESGVREYWIVDPKCEKATVYFFESERFAESYTFDEEITASVFGSESPLGITIRSLLI